VSRGRQSISRGGLAGTAGTKQDKKLAVGDLQIEVVDRRARRRSVCRARSNVRLAMAQRLPMLARRSLAPSRRSVAMSNSTMRSGARTQSNRCAGAGHDCFRCHTFTAAAAFDVTTQWHRIFGLHTRPRQLLVRQPDVLRRTRALNVPSRRFVRGTVIAAAPTALRRARCDRGVERHEVIADDR